MTLWVTQPHSQRSPASFTSSNSSACGDSAKGGGAPCPAAAADEHNATRCAMTAKCCRAAGVQYWAARISCDVAGAADADVDAGAPARRAVLGVKAAEAAAAAGAAAAAAAAAGAVAAAAGAAAAGATTAAATGGSVLLLSATPLGLSSEDALIRLARLPNGDADPASAPSDALRPLGDKSSPSRSTNASSSGDDDSPASLTEPLLCLGRREGDEDAGAPAQGAAPAPAPAPAPEAVGSAGGGAVPQAECSHKRRRSPVKRTHTE